VNSKVKFSLPPVPTYEERISADSITTYGKIRSNSNVLSIDSVNYTNLGPGATLFDSTFRDVTNSGRATLRIIPDGTGKLIVRNIFKSGDTRNISKAGSRIKVDNGGFIIQAKSDQAVADVKKFKDGDIITISNSYKAKERSQFVTAAGRGPRIIQGGKMVWICVQHNQEHRPRSAIGWNQDGQVWFVTSSRGSEAFDFGFRQGGSTSSQIAQWLLQLGATEAILLDGGGSTALYVDKPEEGPRLTRFDLPDTSWVRNLANGFSLQRRD
jgi:hypothetical protein